MGPAPAGQAPYSPSPPRLPFEQLARRRPGRAAARPCALSSGPHGPVGVGVVIVVNATAPGFILPGHFVVAGVGGSALEHALVEVYAIAAQLGIIGHGAPRQRVMLVA